MANLAWTVPSALWILAAIPVVWIAQRAARTTFNPRQRVLQAAIRSCLVAALALALARPVASVRSTRESIVYAVDVSQSIGTPAIEQAARRIDEINAAAHPEHSRIVAFGATARTLENTAALRALALADPTARDAGGPDRSATDLEAGLDAARSELAPGHVPRVILFSDGRATMGDVADAAARLAGAQVAVSTEPMPVRTLDDTWVDAIDVPARLSAGASLPIAVTIGSQRAAAATVEIRSGGTVLAKQTTTLGTGATRVTLDAQIDAPGGATLEASVRVDGDPLPANDTLRRSVWIEPRVRVLYVEGSPSSARYLSGGLAASGFDVAVRPVSSLPVTTAGYEAYDVTILSDVNRGTISAPAMAALTGWVERGGGLLVAGGDAVFGEGTGGYRNTALERLTPVTFERRDEPSVALILVLDRSWSMAGTSIDLCKAAAAAALDVMAEEQSLGVLTFNDKFDWEFTLRNVEKPRVHAPEDRAIEPSGRTLIFPALEQAYLALRTVKARAKHVILLSDGRTYPDDYEGLVKKMTDARITVSSIAVGPSADQELLRDIAKWGNGRQYAVADAHDLPQIFVKEAKTAVSPSFDEKTIKPIVKRAAFLQDVDLAHLPPLRGLTQTVMKDGALEVIATSDDDPLLAFWPVGLGRAAVFASDVKDRWGSEWVKWRGYGPFFAALVHALERQQAPPVALDVQAGAIRGGDRGVTIAVEARDADGGYRDLLRPMIHVTSGNGLARDVQARQVAPGRYEAALIASASQPLAVSLSGEPAPAPSRTVIPDPAAELRWRAPDDDLLKAIAVATGGAWQPSPDALRARPDERSTERRPLWPPLVVLALALWLIDLTFRRVRVFE